MSKHLKEYRKLILTLFALTAAAALLLSVVNALTADPIAQRLEAKRRAAMEAVSPGATVFSQVEFDPALVTDMHAAYKGDILLGYCVELNANGFTGPIDLLVGVSAAGKVTGVSVLRHTETPGLGANADDPNFLDQFVGRSGTIRVGRGGVDAVSGATVTSQAVAQGVSDALEAVAKFQTVSQSGTSDVFDSGLVSGNGRWNR